MNETQPAGGGIDRLTLICVAIVAYAVANVAHEGLGHGGLCLAVGGKPDELNAIYFSCLVDGLPGAAARWVSAGGTLVSLALGAIAALALRGTSPKATPGRYFLWLLMTVCLLQGTGYFLFSGIGNIGDWAAVVRGLSPAWPFRVGLVALGAAGYVLTIRAALRLLAPFLGATDGRVDTGRVLMGIPYLTGGALYLAAGLLNPASPWLVLISAAAASLGGTSALAWMHNLLRDRSRFPPVEAPPFVLPRSPGWLAAGALVALGFVAVLGRSVHL